MLTPDPKTPSERKSGKFYRTFGFRVSSRAPLLVSQSQVSTLLERVEEVRVHPLSVTDLGICLAFSLKICASKPRPRLLGHVQCCTICWSRRNDLKRVRKLALTRVA